MKTASSKIDSQKLLDAARENDYSIPAPVVRAEPDRERMEERKETAELPAVSEAPAPVMQERQSKPVASDRQRKERGRRASHKDIFVRNTNLKARNGRQCYIRNEYHEQIQRIVEVVGNREVTIASYIDNVLAFHFEMFGAEITEELDQRFNSTYNSSIKYEF